MHDFWRDSGFHLLQRDPRGQLTVTDDFLRAYFLRPEVRPVEESCDAERALHRALLDNPRELVSDDRLGGLADPDARDNYRVVLAFRDRLVGSGTVEACYLSLFLDQQGITVPPLFVDQLCHVIVRNILDGAEDGLRARAGECLFREQKVTINDGTIMVADSETVEGYAATGGFGSLGALVQQAQTPLRQIDLDVLDAPNADIYWTRDGRYDLVLTLSFPSAGLDALCRVLEAWVAHFLEVGVSIQPVQKIRDERWVWHVGLDSEGSRLLNDLYKGVDVGEDRLTRLLSLFRLEFADPSVVQPEISGRPIYLALCMGEHQILRLKPQNLLVNLPLSARA